MTRQTARTSDSGRADERPDARLFRFVPSLAVLVACSGLGRTIDGSTTGRGDARDNLVDTNLQGAVDARAPLVDANLQGVDAQGVVDTPATMQADTSEALAAEAGAAEAGAATVARPICSSDGWCWESLLPQGNDVVSIWASAINDVWAATRPGPILHWNGAEWSSFTPRSGKADTTVYSLWGSGPDDVWAVGTAVVHWDGAAWTAIDLPTSAVFASVWGSSANDVWAVGSGGAIAHFDGAAWSLVDSGSDAGLLTVWAASPSDVWASGGGALIHFDGQAWTAVWSPPAPESWSPARWLEALGGTSSTDIWGFENNGFLLHYDGVSWTEVAGATPRSVYAIRAIAPDDVWFLGYGIDHYDGHTWTSMPGAATMLGGWALGKNWMLAGGTSGRIYVWDGRAWSQMARQITPSGYCLGINSLWASASDDVWAVGSWGMVFHSDGRNWRVEKSACESGGFDEFASVAGSARDNVWTVGSDGSGAGTAHRWDGSTWQQVALPPGTLSLWAVWTDGPGDVWAVGLNDRLHFDGSTWSAFDVEGTIDADTGGAPRFLALWGTGPDDLWAVGKHSAVAHWDGTKWTAVLLPMGIGDFDSVWGTSDSDVWVSGEDRQYGSRGAILHWDGSVWKVVLSTSYESVSGIWGAGPTDLWTTVCEGGSCSLDHWDGTAWQKTFPHRENFAAKLFGLASTGDVWAFGSEMILHRRP